MMLTVREAAHKLGIGRTAMYALVHRPDFPAIKLHAHAIRIPEAQLEAWIVQQATQREVAQ